MGDNLRVRNHRSYPTLSHSRLLGNFDQEIIIQSDFFHGFLLHIVTEKSSELPIFHRLVLFYPDASESSLLRGRNFPERKRIKGKLI